MSPEPVLLAFAVGFAVCAAGAMLWPRAPFLLWCLIGAAIGLSMR